MLNETHLASPRYKISDFFSSLLGLKTGSWEPKADVSGKIVGYPDYRQQLSSKEPKAWLTRYLVHVL